MHVRARRRAHLAYLRFVAWAALMPLAVAGCAGERAREIVPEAEAVVPAEPPIDAAAVRARFLSDTTALVAGDTLDLHAGVTDFYRARSFAAAWTDAAARDSVIAALRAAEDEGFRPHEVGADQVDSLLTRGVVDDAARVDRDLVLTNGFIRFAGALLGGRVVIEEVYPSDWHLVPRKAATGEMLAEALRAEKPGVALARALDRLRPRSPEYGALREALARARRDDGLPEIEWEGDVSPGDTADVVLHLRRRLRATRDLVQAAPEDSVARILDRQVSAALRAFQTRRGLEPNGVLDAHTRAALNTPGNLAVPLLAINLERWRWLPRDLGDTHVWVNIPTFETAVRMRNAAGWAHRLRMPVVVGQPGRWRTPVFSDTISQIVFNPTWTIPASIQMESYGWVNPRGVVRQPGPSNPLGRVKFIFPNPYGIYLHDTNARRRLEWEYRALSHGCIRLGDPAALARDLLARQGWDSTRVAAQFAGPWVTLPVDLERPVPVHLVYLTAEATPSGAVRRVPDIYGWDRALANALGYSATELEAAREVVGDGDG